MTIRKPRFCTRRHPQRGLTLIELMIAMVLGLIVVGGAISVIIANRQSYRTNEGLSQVQESTRTAFEVLARDIRQAGSTACGTTNRMANVLLGTGNWWQNWEGIRGYEGGTFDGTTFVGAVAAPAVVTGNAVGQRIAGTDAIMLQGVQGSGLSIVSHVPTSANFEISAASTDFASNDILLVCDHISSAIFQVTNYNSNNVTLVHNTGTGTVQNCSKGLRFPTDCSSENGNNSPAFGKNSQIARLSAVTWYVGNNGRATDGGRSLYRIRLGVGGATVTEEVVAGITNMQIQYKQGTNAALTTTPTWGNVNAVEVTLTATSTDQAVATSTANEGRLERTFTTMIGLRNRIE